MPPLRRLLSHPAAAALIVAAALALRLLVPAGYMPVQQGDRIVLAPCPGTLPSGLNAHAGMAHGDHEPSPSAPGQGCAFADLALPAIGGADPVQLAALLVFVLALALVRRPVPPRSPLRRLRPPAQAPPVPA